MDAPDTSTELCGIAGHDDETISKGEFNRFVRIVNYYHGRPIKADLRALKELVEASNKVFQDHMEADRIFFAKMAGAKWVIYLIAAMLAPVVPLLYYLIKALSTAGIL